MASTTSWTTATGTIADRATGLMWTKGDSAQGLNWQEAPCLGADKERRGYLGHNDWRLPNAKELQSIVDYTRSPDTTSSAAIDPLFACTGITSEAGQADYPFYWTEQPMRPKGRAANRAAAPSTSPSDGLWAT